MEYSWKGRVALVLVILASSIMPAFAVTEAEAIGIFLEQSPQARRVTTIEQGVDAALRVDSHVANPVVAYQVEDAAGVRDEFLTVQQALPITGRRGILGERAKVAATAAAQDAESELRNDVHALRRIYYEVLYRERAQETLRDGSNRLSNVVEILAQREREGEGAGHDLLRAEQEHAELQMAGAEADLALLVARSSFASFFDPELNMDLVILRGDLAPTAPIPDVQQATQLALDQRMELRSLSTQSRRLELEQKAARRRRIPEPRVTAGWKRSEAQGLSDSGFVAGIAFPIPLFDRGGHEFARAKAEGGRIALDAVIATRKIRADVQAAVARERVARSAAQRYLTELEPRADELSQITQLKYEEGESGILELLDSHRMSVETKLRGLAAQYRAKIAEIDREQVVGNEVRP